jgi:hypothetical protein
MSDQHTVTDWKAYFEALGPGTPSPLTRDVQPMYAGPVACSVTFVKGEGLDSLDAPEGVQLLDWCLDVWIEEGKPEMWVFINRAGPPWHVPGQPKAQPRKGKAA